MVNIPLIVAAGSLFTLISGAPVSSSHSSAHRHTERHAHHALSFAKRSYNVLGGSGKAADGWPSHENWWPEFDKMCVPILGNLRLFTVLCCILTAKCTGSRPTVKT